MSEKNFMVYYINLQFNIIYTYGECEYIANKVHSITL